jgi:arylsulfatase A-like enzyme
MNRRMFLQSMTGVVAGWGAESALGGPMASNAGNEIQPDEVFRAEWARVFASHPPGEHEAIRTRNQAARAADPRPNLLLVLTDQQTVDAMSCAGNPHVRTPFIDALARRGTRFTRSYCTAPICTPARASLMTGFTAHQTGADYLNMAYRPGMKNLGERLQEAGYDTTYLGKWHLPESHVKTSDGIPGFHNLPLPEGLLGTNLGDVTDMHLATRAGHYLRWHAALSPKPWAMVLSLHNPHDICHYCMPGDGMVAMPEPDPEFLVADSLPPLPPNHKADAGEPGLLQERRREPKYAKEMGVKGPWSEAQWRAYLQTYYHMTQSVDRCLQPVLAGLRAGGWADSTVVIFTSDHGEGMAAHEWVTKLSPYEEVLRVPMIVSAPGGVAEDPARGGRMDDRHLVSGLDVVPTLLDYAGVPVPEDLPGRSLRPLIESRPVEWRSEVVCEIALHPDKPEAHGRAVIGADGWKFIRWSSGARPEQLFDLANDPGETRNLAGAAEAAGPAARLREALRHYAAETADAFPVPAA